MNDTIDLSAYVAAIGTALGHNDWTPTKDGNDNALQLGTGARMWFRLDGKRITVHGSWPQDGAGSVVAPGSYDKNNYSSISFSAEKAPAVAAKDIARRFLPGYLETWTAMRQRADGHNAHAQKTRDGVKALLAVAPSARQPNNGQRDEATVYLGADYHGYQARVSGDNVRFEHFDVPLAVALRILPLLKKQEEDK